MADCAACGGDLRALIDGVTGRVIGDVCMKCAAASAPADTGDPQVPEAEAPVAEPEQSAEPAEARQEDAGHEQPRTRAKR